MKFNHNKLKEIRTNKNITMTSLMFSLDQCGLRLSRQTLVNWENGKTNPDANDLAVLSSFYGVNILEFYSEY